MIIDIPTQHEFFTTAEALIHTAWTSLIELVVGFEQLSALEGSEHASVSTSELQDYWTLARPTLISSLALVQQAVEFYLKAEIVSVSPYLLLSNDIRRWPQRYEESDARFPDFRTIDAQDLPKLYNTVTTKRLTGDVANWFRDLREQRNRIMHTVDSQFLVSPERLAETILRAHEHLVGKQKWMDSRRTHLGASPTHGVRIGTDAEHQAYIAIQLHKEFASAVHLLPSDALQRYFGYQDTTESWHCPNCNKTFEGAHFYDSKWTDDFAPTLQAGPESPGRPRCLICAETFALSGQSCPACDSPSMVEADSCCLACAYTAPKENS